LLFFFVQYFGIFIHNFQSFSYIKKLQESIKGKTPEELKTEEHQIKVTALKTTSNISALIRDLFHSPPSFKSNIHLSWVTPKARANVNVVSLFCLIFIFKVLMIIVFCLHFLG
jgi:hypothetical protein